ncbi:probable serine/threonine-protein kinase PBL18 [Olea europaea var. sylvestris]|nr:probable serine/threonine-protein kinase PBL18 [Olea europaea var. sylvestris]
MGNCIEKTKQNVGKVDKVVMNPCKGRPLPPPSPPFSSGSMEHFNSQSHPLPTPIHPIQTQPDKVCTLPMPRPDTSPKHVNKANVLPMPIPETSTAHEKSRILPVPTSESEILASPYLKSFRFDELKNATGNFHPDSLLGEGGFGCVFKGWLDEESLMATRPGSGRAVAVKTLIPQGFQGHKEWLSEVNYLGRLHHPNLVKLIGYCLEGENRILVYEFMPNGSLENHLFRRHMPSLSWTTRIKVAAGAARGLCFLHNSESPVIYRDFKTSNILLDSEFNAKLSDFGLAKSGPTGFNTHVTTRVMGTEGYCAPEYRTTGKLTVKCDVYSFGIVLLELLTGRRSIDESRGEAEKQLITWVKPHLQNKRKVFRIMDTKLGGQYPKKGAYIAANLAILCVNQEARFRPPMTYVLDILENILSQKANAASSPKLQSPMNRTPRGSPLPGYRESPFSEGSKFSPK